MKICFIATEIVPTKEGAFTGGLVNNTIRLAKGLSNRGHKVTIITSDVNNIFNNVSSQMGWAEIVPIRIHFPYGSLLNNIEFLILVIPKFLLENRKHKFSIIHCHSGYSIFGIIPAVLYLLSFRNTLFTLYSPIQKSFHKDKRGLYQSLSSSVFSRLFLLRAGKITTISHNTKQSLVNIGFNEEKIDITLPIIDTDHFQAKHSSIIQNSGKNYRDFLNIPKECTIILYCGNWAFWKGIDLLIDSFSELKKIYPNIVLIIAWGEPYSWYDERKKEIEDKIDQLGIRESIRELGIIKDINILMANSDIYVAPFRNTDGVADQPLSILEAMASGNITIATRIGGIPEFLKTGYNGILISPDNNEELRNALVYVIKNMEKCKRMSENAIKYVFENYGSKTITGIYEQYYEEVISNNHRY